jgi:zinc protease
MTQASTLAPAGRWTAGVHREVLPNGLTLLVQRDDSAPAVAVVTHVRAGFFDEPDHWVGISHVLEHMFFKGTPTRGVGAIARETKAAGGYLNASTSYDGTSYFVVLPASQLAAGIAVQADALRHSLIDASELKRELQVIIQEARRKQDSPDAVAHETLFEVMFDRHRIRRWRIGREAELAAFTRDDVAGYYHSRYVPARTVVSVVGAIDVDEAVALLRRTYGDWPSAEGAVNPSPEEPAHRGVRARTLRGDVSRAELVLGWHTVPPLHADAIALDMAAGLLCSGRGAWLYRLLREPGVVTGIGASNFTPTELGVFTIAADLEPAQLDRTLEGIAAAVARLAAEGPDAVELERARTLMRSRWARRMESMEGRAAALAATEALGGIHLLDEDFEQLAAVTADDVRRVAERYLAPDAVNGVVFLPEGEGEDLTPERLAAAFATSGRTAIVPPTLPGLPVSPARTVTGSRTADVLHVPLPGVDLLVRRKAGVPSVTLGYYVPRYIIEDPAHAGLGALTIRSAVRGAGTLDAAALAYATEGLGGTLSASASLDWTGLSLGALSDNLGPAAVLLRLAAREPALAETDVSAERGVMTEEARQVADDMFRYPFQLAFAAAFAERGYGRAIGGLPETLATLDVAQVREWHRTRFASARATIVAVGDLDPDRAAAELAGIFGDLPAAVAGELPPPQVQRHDADAWSRVVERDKKQTAFAMVFPGPGRRDPFRHAADVWSAIASGLGGRLFEALRDKRSLAYTVLGSSWSRRDGGAMLTYIATSPEREEEARAAMLVELRRFAEELVSEAELALGVNYLAGQAEVHRQSGAAVLGEIVDAWIAGEGLQELHDPAARYRGVTAEMVREVAARYLTGPRAEGIVRGVRR